MSNSFHNSDKCSLHRLQIAMIKPKQDVNRTLFFLWTFPQGDGAFYYERNDIAYGCIYHNNDRRGKIVLLWDFIGGLFNLHKFVFSLIVNFALVSRIERKYCSISTSYLIGLFDIYVLLHI